MDHLLSPAKLAKYFDHTLLKPDVTERDLKAFCGDCIDYGFAMAAVNPAAVPICRRYLQGTDVHVGAAVGFPLGQNTIETKQFEAQDAIRKGADEIDYVIPGNDDAIRAVKLLASVISDAVLEAKQGESNAEEAPAEAPVEE